MITIIVKDASYCQVLKNMEHWEFMREILKYTKKEFIPTYNTVARVEKSIFDERGGKFPTGLLDYVKKELSEINVDYKIEWENKPVKLDICKDIKIEGIVPESYQEKIIRKVHNTRNGIIKSPTGSGKSLVSAFIIKTIMNARNYPTTLVLTPTSDIARNTQRELKRFLSIPIGMLGDGKLQLQKVNVGLYQTVRDINLKELNALLDMVIVDECHGAKNQSYQKILNNLPNVWYRYGLSATPIPISDKGDWFKVTGALGEVIISITDKEAISRVIPVEVYMAKFKGLKKHDTYDEIYRYDVLLNENRCKLLLDLVEMALGEFKKQNCLLLVDEYQQAKLIWNIAKDYCPHMIPEIAHRGVGKSELENMKNRINNGTLPFCIATPVWSVGTNIVGIESIVMGSARKSSINTAQKIGRGRRRTKDKEALLLFDIFDDLQDNKHFKEYSIKRMNYYKRNKWLKEFFD